MIGGVVTAANRLEQIVLYRKYWNIPGTHVDIDALVTMAETIEEIRNIFRKVLLRCREKNIKLARHKLEFGT